MPPAPRLTRAELALLDRLASGEIGLPSAVLMENAGRGAAEEVLRIASVAAAPRVSVLAGSGNNGGDACVLARHLADAGVGVELFAACRLEDLRGDAAIMRRAAEKIGIAVHDVSTEAALARARERLDGSNVLVDGLLGTGFRGEMRPGMTRLVEAVNACRAHGGARVVALDLPSGLDADSGRPARSTIVADVTVTFAAWKVGFDAPAAQPFLGRVVVAGIGISAELAPRVRG
jgi:NAD(P)H-hydrate epimerase